MKLQLALCGASALALAAATAVTAQNRTVTAPALGGRGPAVSCETLARTALPNARVASAVAVPAGRFVPPGAPAAGPAPAGFDLPAFCRVAVTLTPSADSDIKAEVWLPTAAWNGKFMMVGNGGWSGSITFPAMAQALMRGYATASTDTGHEGPRGIFALGHPEKLIDFAWRAVHETAVQSKALVAAYYGGAPRLSYWNGCSSGGKQGLKEVQKFPADFDGVIAGAPANNWVRLQTQSLWASQANIPKGATAPIIGDAQTALLHKAVIASCDSLDGVKDEQIQDPRQCNFKPASLLCKSGQNAAECLTPAQVEAADKIYAPLKNPRTGELIYPGMPPGSELTWKPVIGKPWETGDDHYKYTVFKDPNWDFYSLDFDKDLAKAEAADVGIVATETDLSAFKARGGKIIQYHGWADPFIPTENSINYYESVVARQGGLDKAEEFHRLFLIPGMGHCNGAYSLDWITALEQWREGGVAPDVILAKRLPPPGYTPRPVTAVVQAPEFGERPMCAYPMIAHHIAGANAEEPVNYVCQAGPRGARPGYGPARMGAKISAG
ncbi:MAG TPA: tannase/feruloyl esterase family alpha/beta hydrolase [Caulobacteraceae bacterium]|jgi:feruloyl esterase|nr:tannase/feruloyl esterase family alpha/beta hydrolase [Caulobacteraceae bacterium]